MRRAKLIDVQALIQGRRDSAEALEDPLFERLISAVGAVGIASEVGPADLAALLRQFLVRDWNGGSPPGLVVPTSSEWPDPGLWSDSGCSCVRYDVTTFWVCPKTWTPEWLGPSHVEAIAAACREEPRRRREPVPADPIVSELVPSINGNYLSAGQGEAVRSVFIAPPGATILACLPTGAGKTLAFQVPALQGIPRKKLVVVVVPTVALARDQERRFRELLRQGGHDTVASRPLAYHSGLDTQERRALFDGLREGALPIVFTSPEAALGALRGPLLTAAGAGRIALFAIDEAHMVSQWGDSFRPEFQLVAGLRDEMQQEAETARHERFPTLLLTATLTEEGYETLRQAFERGGGFHVVAEPQLREEPAIVIAEAPDAETRRRRILEALFHLPRPLLLYTTERAHADDWGRLLAERGHRRIAVVKGGDMATQRGERVLDAWTHRRLDIVVATSAFGLGVDQGDVRAVVHACLPESLDRYYQEVGRSGRDGLASVALLVPAPEDRPVAESLASNPSISVERGLERWIGMFRSREHGAASDGTIVVPLNACPAGVPYSSDLNVAWNQRTLVLMARAGLVSPACVSPPDCKQGEGELQADFEARRARTFKADALKAAVRIEDHRHEKVAAWTERVEPVRRRLRQQDERNIENVHDLAAGRQSPGSLFRSIYTVEAAGIYPPPPGIEPAVVSLERTRCHIRSDLQAMLESSATRGRLLVWYSAPTGFMPLRRWRSDIAQRTLERLAGAGVLEFSLTEDFVDLHTVWKALEARSPVGFVCQVGRERTRETHKRPRVTVLGAMAPPGEIMAALEVERDQHIILFPDGVLDPLNPRRRLQDTFNSMSLDAFAGRLTQ